MEARRYIRETARPMLSEPTRVTPKLDRLNGVKAVFFDIYGTLLISDAGGLSPDCSGRKLQAMALVSERLGGDSEPSILLEEYNSRIERRLVGERERGVEFPEVEIREVWREVLAPLLLETPTEAFVEEIAIVYECNSNPVWPMPGADELLKQMKSSGRKLGIVSNAQFYTQLVMEELFGNSLSELGFSPDWIAFSYRMRQGKPSIAVFEKSKKVALDSGLSADEVLYVGNDMEKDIGPASSVGFRTCLFAGDARSLRLGAEGVDHAMRCADVVVTQLSQIVEVLNVEQ